MSLNKSLRPDQGPGLEPRDLISFEHFIKDEIAGFLPFKSYRLFFPERFEGSELFERLAGGETVYLRDESSVLLPLAGADGLMAVFVARGVRLKAPKSAPRYLSRLASMLVEKLSLHKAAISDAGTGLARKERLMDRLAAEIESVRECLLPDSGRSMDQEETCYSAGFGLVTARLHGLEEIAGSHGVELRSGLLKAAAGALRGVCPEHALAARSGEAELAVFLPAGSPAACGRLAEEVRAALAGVTVSDPLLEQSVGLEVSAGYATFPRDLDARTSRLSSADQAMGLLHRARIAAEAGARAGTAFSFEEIKASGGRVSEIMSMNRLGVDLGSRSGAAQGERYLVYPPGSADSSSAPKAEIVLTRVGEDSSRAEIVHLSHPSDPVAENDRLVFLSEAAPLEDSPPDTPAVDEESGLPAYTGFMRRFVEASAACESFALFLIRLPDRSLQEESGVRTAAETVSEALPQAEGGRYGRNCLMFFLPGTARRKALNLAAKVHSALNRTFGEGPAVGVAVHPCLGFAKGEAPENCRKALEYAELLPEPRVGPLDSLALTISADKLFAEGRLYDAMEEYKLALMADKENTLARNSLGVCLVRAGRPAEAARQFKTAIRHAPADVNAWYNLGRLAMQRERDQEAREAFDKCLELDSGHFFSRIRLGQLAIRAGRLGQAETQLRLAEKLENGNAGLTKRLLARLAIEKGDREEAKELLHQSLTHDPRDAVSLHLMAELYLEDGEDPQIAEALARQSAAVRPGHAPFLRTLARALEAQGRSDEAARAAARAENGGDSRLTA
jgi:Tfp pilus assembly protein PilF